MISKRNMLNKFAACKPGLELLKSKPDPLKHIMNVQSPRQALVPVELIYTGILLVFSCSIYILYLSFHK